MTLGIGRQAAQAASKAALSGSNPKVPGFAGGCLLLTKSFPTKRHRGTAMMASDNIDHLRPHILTWASAGFACNRRYDLDRPQLRYPKTICMVWVSPTINKIIYPYAWLDLHYKSDNTLEAIGGFWIDGVEGDLKPQQD